MKVPAVRHVVVGVLGVLLLLGAGTVAVSSLTEDPDSVAAQARAGDRKGYVSGDGNVETIPAADRGEPVQLTGALLDGTAWSIDSTRGEVLVVNVWGSWCAPCVAEAPTLEQVWKNLQADQVPARLIGIDFREEAERGAAFVAKEQLTYPSLSDESGVLISSLQGKASTVPTTLVLDPQGRIAARVAGAVEASTLRGLVDDVVAES
ncbi:TlpA family protein disulfide reductase [Phycicoccus sp. CSK15P-2]|uniref:TlpA family protein disulfide reductase n=1 Tax=Phycicoccus sp. CSK15P-2 TaxID=2807627 RepID=UPI00194DE624|nr:TlpA disulfide reductase family protein [Phycicoccus sp. CSK15P-2]MBM6404960.1 TlpA family protein disulfide reductase [Phycicoccus sp. CSK15P-2]